MEGGVSMDLDLPAGRRPWNIPDTMARGVPGMERKNPPAYLTREVAEVCLNCRRRRCDGTYEGCDEYQQAVKQARKDSRMARKRKK